MPECRYMLPMGVGTLRDHKRAIRFLRTGITGRCELPNVGARNGTLTTEPQQFLLSIYLGIRTSMAL